MPLWVPVGAAVMSLAPGPLDPRTPFVVDGAFDEWAGRLPVALDSFGDAAGAFDVTSVYAAVFGSDLFLTWDTNAGVNLQAGSFLDGTVLLEFGFSDGDTLTIDLRARVAHNGVGPVPWPVIRYETMPTFAAPRYETRVDLSSYVTGPGDTFTLDFGGSDSLDGGPVTLRTNRHRARDPHGTLVRPAGTDVRIASLNTLTSGLTNPPRRDAIGRLIDSVDAEIVCLQEEYSTSAAEAAARLNEIDPLEDGAAWNVWKWNDNMIASPHPVIGHAGGDGWAAAVVETPAGPVFVASVHPKCCGHAGNTDDLIRTFQMMDLAGTIAGLRAGSLEPELAPYAAAPVVVVGDWNLVGSDMPLEVMLDPSGPALTELPMGRVVSGRATTWESPGGFGFSPGRLDLLTYDAAGLGVRNGFVLDSRELPAAALGTLGLQASDSAASDHLMLVADFTIVP